MKKNYKKINNKYLESIICKKLKDYKFKDFTYNGLQIIGKKKVSYIITGVTANYKLLDIAINRENADAVIVHHGIFWKKDLNINNKIKFNKIKLLLKNNLNLYSWHLPLDSYTNIGNNMQIALKLGIKSYKEIKPYLLGGIFNPPINNNNLKKNIIKILNKNIIFFYENAPKYIKKVAICAGSGNSLFEFTVLNKFDAFITGEISEKFIHIAREYGINLYIGGHHATEKFGVKALGNWISKKFQLKTKFIDIFSPL